MVICCSLRAASSWLVYMLRPALAAVCYFAFAWTAVAQQTTTGAIGTGVSVDVERIPDFVRDDSGRFDDRLWTVKFLCGEILPLGSPEIGSPLAPGSYRTDINIFNGQLLKPAEFAIRGAIANRPNESPGDRAGRDPAFVLEPVRAVQLDCTYIRSLFSNAPPGFIKGFVQLEVETRRSGRSTLIEVVGVYTVKNVDIAPVIGEPPNPN